MNPLNLPDHGYGRALHDALLDARWAHPELFPATDPDDDGAYFPLDVGDAVLEARIIEALSIDNTRHCEHQFAIHERVDAPGITFYPPDVLLASAVYVFASLPDRRYCSACWSKTVEALVPKLAGVGWRCDRCRRSVSGRPSVVLRAFDHGIHTFFCCTDCRDDVNGGVRNE